jgi:hypothetical protein
MLEKERIDVFKFLVARNLLQSDISAAANLKIHSSNLPSMSLL